MNYVSYKNFSDDFASETRFKAEIDNRRPSVDPFHFEKNLAINHEEIKQRIEQFIQLMLGDKDPSKMFNILSHFYDEIKQKIDANPQFLHDLFENEPEFIDSLHESFIMAEKIQVREVLSRIYYQFSFGDLEDIILLFNINNFEQICSIIIDPYEFISISSVPLFPLTDVYTSIDDIPIAKPIIQDNEQIASIRQHLFSTSYNLFQKEEPPPPEYLAVLINCILRSLESFSHQTKALSDLFLIISLLYEKFYDNLSFELTDVLFTLTFSITEDTCFGSSMSIIALFFILNNRTDLQEYFITEEKFITIFENINYAGENEKIYYLCFLYILGFSESKTIQLVTSTNFPYQMIINFWRTANADTKVQIIRFISDFILSDNESNNYVVKFYESGILDLLIDCSKGDLLDPKIEAVKTLSSFMNKFPRDIMLKMIEPEFLEVTNELLQTNDDCSIYDQLNIINFILTLCLNGHYQFETMKEIFSYMFELGVFANVVEIGNNQNETNANYSQQIMQVAEQVRQNIEENDSNIEMTKCEDDGEQKQK